MLPPSDPDRIQIAFDDPRLVANAVPTPRRHQRLSLWPFWNCRASGSGVWTSGRSWRSGAPIQHRGPSHERRPALPNLPLPAKRGDLAARRIVAQSIKIATDLFDPRPTWQRPPKPSPPESIHRGINPSRPENGRLSARNNPVEIGQSRKNRHPENHLSSPPKSPVSP